MKSFQFMGRGKCCMQKGLKLKQSDFWGCILALWPGFLQHWQVYRDFSFQSTLGWVGSALQRKVRAPGDLRQDSPP